MSAIMTFPVEVKIPARIAIATGTPREFTLTGDEVNLPVSVIDWMQTQKQYQPIFAPIVDPEIQKLFVDEQSADDEQPDGEMFVNEQLEAEITEGKPAQHRHKTGRKGRR